MSYMGVEKGEHRDFALTQAARKFFGGWHEAVEAAGFDLSDVGIPGSARYPTSEAVIGGIQKRQARGMALNVSALMTGKLEQRDVSLAFSAKRYFGSWPAALGAAGIDPSTAVKRTTKYRSSADVIRELRQRVQSGLPINFTNVVKGKHRDVALTKAARKFCGGWQAALKSAGV